MLPAAEPVPYPGEMDDVVLERRRRRHELPKAQLVELLAGDQRRRSSRRRRSCRRGRDLLRRRPGGDDDVGWRARRRIDVERQHRRGGDAGSQLVADRPGELAHAAPLGRSPQVGLVGDQLAVEGEHVEDRRRGVEQGDARVVGLTGRQPAELDAPADRPSHRAEEPRMRVDGDVEAGESPGAGGCVGHHKPPSTSISRRPFSGRLAVVVEAQHLARADPHDPGRQLVGRRHAERMTGDDVRAPDSRDRRQRGVDRRQVQRLAEAEAVGVEQPGRTVGVGTRSEGEAGGAGEVAAEVPRLQMESELDVERHELRVARGRRRCRSCGTGRGDPPVRLRTVDRLPASRRRRGRWRRTRSTSSRSSATSPPPAGPADRARRARPSPRR